MWDKKWVIGNWKMNGRLQNNNALVHKLRSMPVQQKVCIGIAPPNVLPLRAYGLCFQWRYYSRYGVWGKSPLGTLRIIRYCFRCGDDEDSK